MRSVVLVSPLNAVSLGNRQGIRLEIGVTLRRRAGQYLCADDVGWSCRGCRSCGGRRRCRLGGCFLGWWLWSHDAKEVECQAGYYCRRYEDYSKGLGVLRLSVRYHGKDSSRNSDGHHKAYVRIYAWDLAAHGYCAGDAKGDKETQGEKSGRLGPSGHGKSVLEQAGHKKYHSNEHGQDRHSVHAIKEGLGYARNRYSYTNNTNAGKTNTGGQQVPVRHVWLWWAFLA